MTCGKFIVRTRSCINRRASLGCGGLLVAVALMLANGPAFAQSLRHDDSGGLRIDGVLISSGASRTAGALVNPWAPASDLTTLAQRAQQRSAELADDPIACWIADLAIRDGQPLDKTQVRQQREAFEKNGAFRVRDDESGLWVANAAVGLLFRKTDHNRELVSFYDLRHRIELIGRVPEQGSPFRLQVVRYREDGTTGVQNLGPQWRNISQDPSVVVEVDGGNARSASHEVSIEGDKLELRLTWEGIEVPDSPGSLAFSTRIELKADDAMTRWRSAVSGDLPRAGLSKVRCPVIPAFGYAGENDVCYTWGSQHGLLKRGDAGVSYGTYPSSQWAIQHFSVSFGPQTVLYAATHDPGSNVKSFFVQPGNSLYCSADVPNTGVRGNAEYEQRYDTVIGPMTGDWFDAAQKYRQWATANAPWAAVPLHEREDVNHRMLKVAYWARCSWTHDNADDGHELWAFDQAMSQLPPRYTIDWYIDALGLPPERLGAIHYNWQEELWDTGLPYWRPLNDAVVEELKRESAMGVSTYIYTNPCWIAPTRPEYDDAAEVAITRNLDGSLYYEDYNERMYEISRGTDLFRQVLLWLAEQSRDLGANGVYYDQVSGVLRGGDYDPAKGLASLGRGGNVLTHAKQDAMRYVREKMGPEFGFVSEFYVETSQNLWDVTAVTIHHDTIEVPLIPAIYGGYVVLHGSGLDAKTRPTAAVVVLGRNFLWGTSQGWTQFATEIRRVYTKNLLRQIVQLRCQLDDFVVYGKMLRPPVFEETPTFIPLGDWYVMGNQRQAQTINACEATLWEAQDGRRALLLANYDQSPQMVYITRESLNWHGEWQPTLLEPSSGATLIREPERLGIELPGRSVAAVILETADHRQAQDVSP